MTTFSIIGISLVSALYLFITQYLFRMRLHIERNRKGMFHQDRNRYFVWLEGALVILFIAATFQLSEILAREAYSIIILLSPIFALFFLLGISQGLEEWISRRDKKSYYYDWAGSLLILALFLVLFIGNQIYL